MLSVLPVLLGELASATGLQRADRGIEGGTSRCGRSPGSCPGDRGVPLDQLAGGDGLREAGREVGGTTRLIGK